MFESSTTPYSLQTSVSDEQMQCRECVAEGIELTPGSDGVFRCPECHYDRESARETIEWNPDEMKLD